ncbi:MAG: helicase HerA-like domain-containing protein [Planctomycetaceae bacterium]|nr:helicase HerA-like domain-containing protein [Planctomycetaceae bacterium]
MQWLWTAPADNERGPRYMEKALAAIHQALVAGQSVTLSVASSDGQVGLFVRCNDDLAERVRGPLIANYPQCSLTPTTTQPARADQPHTLIVTGELVPEIFPLLRHPQFEDQLNRAFADPIDSVLRAVRPETGLDVQIEWIVTPVTQARRHRAVRAVQLLDREFFRRHPHLAEYFARTITRPRGVWRTGWLGWLARCSPIPAHTSLERSTSRLHEREENLHAAAAKVGGHLFDVQLRLIVTTDASHWDAGHDRLQQLAGALGAFTSTRLATFHWHDPRRERASRHGPTFLLAHDELATLFHPPTASVSSAGLQTSAFAELEPPAMLPTADEPDTSLLGRVRFRDDERPVRITRDAKRRHLYIVGATGTGKSTLLLNLMSQGLQAGEGLTVIDVHGDLADGLLQLVPSQRTNEVIVFDPAGDNVVPFNPLACPHPDRRDQVVSGVVSAFRKLYDSWGPRLENLLRFAVFAVVERQGTLLDVHQLLTDAQVRERVVPRIEDDIVRSFWEHEFKSWNTQYRTEAVSSVTNKILPFLTNRHLRAIVTAAPSRGLDVRQVMDRQQVLIIKLSRGKLGQDNTTLLGSLLLTAIEQAALSRADIPEEQRRDHSLYLDEFQTLVTPSTGILLSESRKYRLNLTLSHQLTRQLDDATWQTVLGNCGTFVAFRVRAEDAESLAPTFSKFPGQLAPASLMGLPNYTCYVRMLLAGGMPSAPFSLQTLPPPEVAEDRSDIVRRVSQRRFGALNGGQSTGAVAQAEVN